MEDNKILGQKTTFYTFKMYAQYILKLFLKINSFFEQIFTERMSWAK